MASERVVQSVLAAIVITAALFVIYATYGRSMDVMQLTFNTTATNLTLASGWHTVIRNGLSTSSWWSGWGVFWTSGILVDIASWIWVGKTIIIDSINDRPGGFQ